MPHRVAGRHFSPYSVLMSHVCTYVLALALVRAGILEGRLCGAVVKAQNLRAGIPGFKFPLLLIAAM